VANPTGWPFSRLVLVNWGVQPCNNIQIANRRSTFTSFVSGYREQASLISQIDLDPTFSERNDAPSLGRKAAGKPGDCTVAEKSKRWSVSAVMRCISLSEKFSSCPLAQAPPLASSPTGPGLHRRQRGNCMECSVTWTLNDLSIHSLPARESSFLSPTTVALFSLTSALCI
jgi:hypothetical protein